MHAHAVTNNEQAFAGFYTRSVGLQCHAGFAERHHIIGGGFDGSGGFGAGHFAPVQSFVFKNNHRIGIVPGSFEQTFEVGAIAGVSYFDTPDIGHHRLDAGGVVRAAAAVSADGYPQDGRHGPLSVGKVATAAQLGEQLIEARPDVIGKLHFHNRAQARRRHACRAADDECLHDGRVENSMTAEFLGQRGTLAENAAQPGAHILTIDKTFGMLFEQFFEGEERTVHHYFGFVALWFAFAALFGDGSRGKIVRKQVFGARVFGLAGGGEIGSDQCLGLGFDLLQIGLRPAFFQHEPAEQRVGIAQLMCLQIVAVPLFAHAGGVVIEQGYGCVNEEGAAFATDGFHHLADDLIALREIAAVYAAGFDAMKAPCVFGGILSAGFGGIGGNVPAIVLHHI